jgi:heat shock protein HslJ
MKIVLILSFILMEMGSAFAWAGQSPVLEGMPWKMVSYLDSKGKTVTALPRTEVTAAFQNGRISGKDGCNQYGAAYKVSDNSLTIQLGMSTMMACEPKLMEQAQDYLSALSSSATYQIADKQLQIIKGSGQVLVTFAVLEPTPLAGTVWKATMYNNGRGGAQSLAAGTEITAVFGPKGALSGLASCNQYSATYEAVNNTFKINGSIGATKMMCEGPIMQQEIAYLAALARATTYRIESNRMELRDATGALQASYVAQP